MVTFFKNSSKGCDTEGRCFGGKKCIIRDETLIMIHRHKEYKEERTEKF